MKYGVSRVFSDVCFTDETMIVIINTTNQLVIKWYINRSKIGIVLFVTAKISYRISIKTTIYSMKCTLYVFLKHERV